MLFGSVYCYRPAPGPDNFLTPKSVGQVSLSSMCVCVGFAALALSWKRFLALSMNVPGTSDAVQQIRGKRRRQQKGGADGEENVGVCGVRRIYVRVIVMSVPSTVLLTLIVVSSCDRMDGEGGRTPRRPNRTAASATRLQV
jgi:hypothetical protein